ncbi:hypothetical protein [Flavisolibacter nicotianae]|nr:hypothetical protein [Flavisolibacter nicotianae]
MKLLLLMFVFLCLHTTTPVKGTKKAGPALRKEAKASFHLAPSILIVNF